MSRSPSKYDAGVPTNGAHGISTYSPTKEFNQMNGGMGAPSGIIDDFNINDSVT